MNFSHKLLLNQINDRIIYKKKSFLENRFLQASRFREKYSNSMWDELIFIFMDGGDGDEVWSFMMGSLVFPLCLIMKTSPFGRIKEKIQHYSRWVYAKCLSEYNKRMLEQNLRHPEHQNTNILIFSFSHKDHRSKNARRSDRVKYAEIQFASFLACPLILLAPC